MDLSFLNGLKDYLNIEIKNPDNLVGDIKNIVARHLSSGARGMMLNNVDESKLNNPAEKLDLTQYFSVNFTDKTKKWLMVIGGGILLYLMLKGVKK